MRNTILHNHIPFPTRQMITATPARRSDDDMIVTARRKCDFSFSCAIGFIMMKLLNVFTWTTERSVTLIMTLDILDQMTYRSTEVRMSFKCFSCRTAFQTEAWICKGPNKSTNIRTVCGNLSFSFIYWDELVSKYQIFDFCCKCRS